MTHTQIAEVVDAASKPLELAIVLPTLNEQANIAPMVERIEQRSGRRLGKPCSSTTTVATAPRTWCVRSPRPTRVCG